MARYLEDYAPGQTFGSGRLRVDKARVKAFAAEFDPQPFHLDEWAATSTIFAGLAASGWHTAAMTMRLLVDGELKPVGGIVGLGFDEFLWPRPVRPGDELHVESEISEVQPLQVLSRPGPHQGPHHHVQSERRSGSDSDREPAWCRGSKLPKRTPGLPVIPTCSEKASTACPRLRPLRKAWQRPAAAPAFMVWRKSWFGCGDPLRCGNRVPFDPDGALTA